jgi:uncharacterized membrane protein YozB (DUF420 family)
MSMGTTSASMVVPPLLQQESLILVFVALGIGIVGMGFGRIRSKDSLQLHRWVMTGAVALNLIAILVVMLPSLVFFYIDPNVTVSSSFSILQIVHAIVGFPAFTLALIFAFNDLPRQTKKYMVITAILWLTSIALGAIVYFTMPN